MMGSLETAFAHLYLPMSIGNRELFTFHYDIESGNFRSIDGKLLRIYPWSESENFLSSQLTTQFEDFASLAAKSIGELNRNKLRKVVISRVQCLERSVSAQEAFQRLVQLHPDALVYHLCHPTFGEWIGATPELLFAKEGNKFHTMALAGTLPANDTSAWSQKLLDEHEFVVQDVYAAFRELHVDKISRSGPHERLAGTVKHLETRFTFQSLVSDDVLRKVLHPTSAICGYPRGLAAKWIAANEHHERRLYCGLLSIEDADKSYVFVNLRCAQLFENRIDLFAGVGLTALSEIHDEWRETERKLNTIRSHFES